jgi:drug/metabolite transporter (DMT)-like permease
MNQRTKAHLAVLAANLIFGINFSVVKFVTPSLIHSFGLNVARVTVTTALFWLLFLLKPSNPTIRREDWWRFIICAASGVAINQMFFIKGLSLTYSIHASLLILITPILITFIAAWLVKEKLTVYKAIGLASGITGAVILVSSRENSGSGTNIVLGDLFIIINAISYSFYMVLARKLMHNYAPLHVLRWVFTLGTLMILPFGWNEFVSAPWSNFGFVQWSSILFVVLGATFFAYLFNIYGIRHLGASITGAYIYSQPIFAAIIAAVFLHESFTIAKLIAAILIFAGVYLATAFNREKDQ